MANTTTDTGLHIETSIDYATYEKGIEVTDEELESLNIKREKFRRMELYDDKTSSVKKGCVAKSFSSTIYSV